MSKSLSKFSTTQHQLDDILSGGLTGMWLFDIKSGLVAGDRFVADMFGLDPDKAAHGLSRQEFSAGVYHLDREWVGAEVNKIIKSKQTSYQYEFRTVCREGTVRWLLARGRVERDSTGKPTGMTSVLVDISERKKIENNLSYLAKASAVLSASLDYHKTFQSIAQLMVPEIADWCSVDIMDGDQLAVVAIAHENPAKAAWARKLREKQLPHDKERRNGTYSTVHTGKIQYIPVISEEMLKANFTTPSELKIIREIGLASIIIVPIPLNNENIGAITLINSQQGRWFTPSDVEMAKEIANRASLAISNAQLYDNVQRELNERTRLEEELRVANEELEHRVDVRTSELEQTNLSLQRSNQELQDFAYVASHDLQEPLRKIQAFGNLLQNEYGDQLGDEGSDYLTRMRGAAARMSILIDDILSFSRVTTKGREFTAVNLHTIVQEVVEDLEVRISETGAVIKIGDLPTIQADPMQMRQLIQNLIANAIKFHRPGVPPVVSISAASRLLSNKSRVCQLKIADNGIGFEEKYATRIFAVFQRLHNRDAYDGTGIGLAVCRKIVERHSGTITARSKPDKGSTFIVELPIRHKEGDNLL